ncbi:MAG: general secretion pathway protein J [Lentisphaeria bacterium]|jgi:general secretion pathway protein J
MSKSCVFTTAQRGLTLVEVLVAIVIMAIIASISYQSLSVTVDSKDVVEKKLKEISRIDRMWLLMEADLRHVLNYKFKQSYGSGSGSELPALTIDNGGGYFLVLLRGGHANPLNFNRSELIRVGYRVENKTLWRDVWYDLSSNDEDNARQQKIIEDVEILEFRALSTQATSVSAGPWLDQWPQAAQAGALPLAVEVNLELEGHEPIKRLFSLVLGE